MQAGWGVDGEGSATRVERRLLCGLGLMNCQTLLHHSPPLRCHAPAAEKAAKQARKERLLNKQPSPAGLLGGNALLAAHLQQQLLGLVSPAAAPRPAVGLSGCEGDPTLSMIRPASPSSGRAVASPESLLDCSLGK